MNNMTNKTESSLLDCCAYHAAKKGTKFKTIVAAKLYVNEILKNWKDLERA
jgi:hypothetical protein